MVLMRRFTFLFLLSSFGYLLRNIVMLHTIISTSSSTHAESSTAHPRPVIHLHDPFLDIPTHVIPL